MPDYHLFAPLANARGQFARLVLPPPFVIERWTRARIVRLWRMCTELPRFEIEVQADASFCLPDAAKHANVVVAHISGPESTEEANWREAHARFDQHSETLRTYFRLVSLYLNADVEPVVYFWYSGVERAPEFHAGLGNGEPRSPRPGYVDRFNCDELSDFLRQTSLPLHPDYVQLAFEHWEQSLRGARDEFILLSLVTALEALFNTGGQDIRYRTARSIAVLLGRDASDSDEIFESVSKAYAVRSTLVHTGKAKGIEAVWLHGLRRQVRDAILSCYRLQQPKEELSRQLTRLGFGSRDYVRPRT